MSVQDIFLAALEIDDLSQRTAYITQACGGNEALRRKVQALLAAHERSGEFLDVPVLQQMAGDPSRSQQARQKWQGEIDLSFLQHSSKPGSLGCLLHYEVLEIVGRGGCGIVLKAFDEKLHRVVAIKTMMPELAVASPARKRFLREARATAAIRHENVVSIYAVEETPLPFLVMEYIDGQTLQDRINETGPLDVREVVSIGQEVARGLEVAHAKGMVHRDIKPANILLERGSGRAKITDFGLARSADDASLTQSGAISGTPLYMSPEQALGWKVDQRSDLFSLGSVLYVMCTGRPPFRAPTAVAVLKRVVDEQPRPVREIIPEVPEWLVALIAQLHAKDPEGRRLSAGEVVRRLHEESLSRSAPSGSKPKPAAAERRRHGRGEAASPGDGRAPRWPARKTVLAVVSSAILAVALLGLRSSSSVPLFGHTALPQSQPDAAAAQRPEDTQSRNRLAVADDPAADRPFVPMFNGKDFGGWIKNNSKTIKWSIDDQLIRGANSGYHPSKGGELFTVRRDYGDFHFRCEMLAGQRGNTGVLFRQNRTLEHGARRGYLIPNPSADKLSQSPQWGIGSVHEEVFQVGTNPVSPAAIPGPAIRPGEWYELEILVRGDTIRVIVNGLTTTEFKTDDPPARQGCIGFSCPILSSLAVRNVEIREWKPQAGDDPRLASTGRGKTRSSVDGQDPIVGTWRMHMGAWPYTAEFRADGTGEGRFAAEVLTEIKNKNDGSGPPEAFPMQWERTSNDRYAISALGVTLPNVVLSGNSLTASGWKVPAERQSK